MLHDVARLLLLDDHRTGTRHVPRIATAVALPRLHHGACNVSYVIPVISHRNGIYPEYFAGYMVA